MAQSVCRYEKSALAIDVKMMLVKQADGSSMTQSHFRDLTGWR